MIKEYKESPNEIELEKLKQDNENKDREISQLHSEIKNIKDIISNIQKDVSKKDTDFQNIKLELDKKDATINQFKANFQNIKLELDKKNTTINQLTTNISKLESNISKLESDNIKKDENLEELKSNISSIRIKLQNTEYSLFQIQLRDIIKAFIEEVKWSFGLKSEGLDKMIDELKSILDEMVGAQSEKSSSGVKVILDILRNCKTTKLQGNNRGHYVNNIGFDEKILPQNISSLYKKYRQKASYLIKDCDGIALILSVNEINNASEDDEKTKKKI